MAASERSVDIFLASPGDVSDERKVVFDVIAQVDAGVGRPLGWRVRPWGWEMRRPGLGRAQDLINPEVDTCDVLIGILDRAFGTPTGEFESGFEEEFERVRQRREAGESVDAMIYLKELGDEDADPRNMAFRERLKQLALYETYNSLDQLAAKLTLHLGGVVAESAGEVLPTLDGHRQGAAPSHGLSPTVIADEMSDADEGRAALNALAEVLDSDTNADRVDLSLLVRAHLAVSAEISTRNTSSLMHIHDLHRLYEFRGQIGLSQREIYYVARSMAGHGGLGVGWGLLVDMDLEQLGVLLLDESAAVRDGALDQLGPGGFDRIVADYAAESEASTVEVISRLWDALAEEGYGVRRLVDLLRDSQMPEVDELLARQVDDEGEQQVAAFETLVRRLFVSDPAAALKRLADHSAWMPSETPAMLSERWEDVGKEQLLELAGADRQLRLVVLKVLVGAEALDEPELRQLLNDSDDDARRIALQGLFDTQMPLEVDELVNAISRDGSWASDDEAVRFRVEYLKRGDSDWLMGARWSHLDFLGVNALRAAMARGYAPAFDRARRSLDDLEPERRAGRDQIAEALDDENREARLAEVERYSNTYDIVWLEGCLRGLAESGQSSADADAARPYLEHQTGSVRDAAADVLLRVGVATDLDALVAYVSGTYGLRRTTVLHRLLELRPDPGWLLNAISSSNGSSETMRAEVVKAIAARSLHLDDESLDDLLRDNSDAVRAAALRIATVERRRQDLVAMLDDYVAAARYRYYDVIATLDRLVYGPDEVRARAEAKLKEAVAPD